MDGKHKKRSIVKYLFIGFVVFILLGIIGIVYSIIAAANTAIRMVPLSDTIWPRTSQTTAYADEVYDSPEQAMQVYWEIDNAERMAIYREPAPTTEENEVFRREYDDYLVVVYSASFYNGLTRVPVLMCMLFEYKADGVSYPLYIWFRGIETNAYEIRYIWEEEDRVAMDIVQSYSMGYMARVNGGSYFYYGSTLTDVSDSLTILGQEPTEVFPFEYEGETYYFWYYDEAATEGFTDIWESDLDLEAFTLAEVIERFDIVT